MKKSIIIGALITVYCFNSCIPTKPLKGNYLNTFEQSVNISFEEAWSNTLDYISKSGKAIKLIDKTSGVIITEPFRFTEENITNENRKGVLINPKALVVIECEQTYEQMGCELPEMLRGSISFRVKTKEGKSTVSVNLANLEGWRIIYKDTEVPLKQIYSTGVYERGFIDYIKHPGLNPTSK